MAVVVCAVAGAVAHVAFLCGLAYLVWNAHRDLLARSLPALLAGAYLWHVAGFFLAAGQIVFPRSVISDRYFDTGVLHDILVAVRRV